MHILPLSAKELEERLSKIPVIKEEIAEEIVDQEYNALSENAQSGKAVAEALASLDINEQLYVDQTYSPISENPQSGKALAEAIASIPQTTVDQTFDSESINAQSGIAVTEAINSKTIYSNSEPLISDIGGIKASEHTEGFNNISVTDLLTELLYPYTKPVINSVNLIPSAGVKKKGESITLTEVSTKITKKSKPISKVDLYSGSALLASLSGSSITSAGTTLTFSGLNDTLTGTANTTYTVKVSEENGTEDVVSSTAAYTFVDPYYQGVISEGTTINEALIIGLNEKIEAKGTKSYSYTTDAAQCAVIAYPASYGVLKEIKDPNNFTQTWTRYDNVSINSVSYYVYVSAAAAATGCTYKFSY